VPKKCLLIDIQNYILCLKEATVNNFMMRDSWKHTVKIKVYGEHSTGCCLIRVILSVLCVKVCYMNMDTSECFSNHYVNLSLMCYKTIA